MVCYKKCDGSNVVTFFYGGGGGVVKKAMATRCRRFLSSSFFLFLWCFLSSSLKLRINNEMVVFFMLKVVMVRGRRLKKASDLKAQKQNVVSS
jgi:hypothetical protein